MNRQCNVCRVLVFQQDALLAQTLQDQLEKENCVVQCVSTVREAEQLLRDAPPEQQYQLVIVDVTLPDRMGHELMAQLAEVMPSGRPPFVLTMGFGWDPECIRLPWLKTLGPRDSLLYLPFRRDHLRQVLIRALGE